MPNFDSGVKGYIKAHCTVTVSFPIDWHGNMDVKCDHCQFYGRSSKTCQLNKKPIAYPEKYIGQDCPLEFEEDSEENEQVF